MKLGSCPAPGISLEDLKFKEKINHPVHYGGDNPLEVINIIEYYNLDFHLGNVCKYIFRKGKKANEDEITELKKALWYLERKIKQLEDGKD